MKTGPILVLAGAGLAAWLLMSQKGQGEGGTGGSLDIPALFGTGNIGGDPVPGVAPQSQPSAFQISPKIQEAMALYQVPGGFSVPKKAEANPQYGTQYGYGSTGYFSPGTSPGTFFGSDPTGQKQAQANDFYARTAKYNKKASSAPTLKNTMGGSSRNRGGTWTGNTFHRGRYR